MRLRPAASLSGLFAVTRREALENKEQLDAFWVGLDEVRGGGLVRRLTHQLTLAPDGEALRAFVYGHPRLRKVH